jgi:hypothetical protein
MKVFSYGCCRVHLDCAGLPCSPGDKFDQGNLVNYWVGIWHANDARDATCCCCFTSGRQILFVFRARLSQMGANINQSWYQTVAGTIDHHNVFSGTFIEEAGAEICNLPVFYEKGTGLIEFA